MQNFRAEIDILGPDQRADAAALMTLLDLFPPAVDLVAHHGWFFDEEHAARKQIQKVMLGAGNGGEELPPGKDTYAARGCRFDLHLFFFGACVFGDLNALLAEARVDSGEQVLSDGSFCQRQQLGFIETGLGTLRFGVELTDGVDLVAKKLDAHRPVGFGRVDIEDAAAACELAGHFHQVHLCIADAGEMASKDLDVEFFASPHGDGEAGVVVAIEKTERGSLCGRDENGHASGGELVESGSALLLHVGMRGEILEWEHIVGRQAHDAAGIDGSG